ncbi:MAG: hypothetical protein ACSW8D_00360 [Prevotella sp.]|jgi:hypothetical protein
MKRIYKKPLSEILELHCQNALLLPASGGDTTNEALSRLHHKKNNGKEEWEEDWEESWEDEEEEDMGYW